MAESTEVRVTFTKLVGWRVYVNGQVLSENWGRGNPFPEPVLYPTQRSAHTAARAIAVYLGAELIVHGRNGKIRYKDSFGHDPRDIKG